MDVPDRRIAGHAAGCRGVLHPVRMAARSDMAGPKATELARRNFGVGASSRSQRSSEELLGGVVKRQTVASFDGLLRCLHDDVWRDFVASQRDPVLLWSELLLDGGGS